MLRRAMARLYNLKSAGNAERFDSKVEMLRATSVQC